MKEIDYIELELDGRCNRRCAFCPNSFIDRTNAGQMSEETLDRLLADLQAADYREPITFSRYNENYIDTPLFLSRVRKIKTMLPLCRLTNASNGDYLNKERIQQSADAGLSFLRINYYPDSEDIRFESKWHGMFIFLLSRYIVDWHDTKRVIRPDYYEAKWCVNDMEVHFISMRPEAVLTSNRGGTVGEPYTRTMPCHSTRLYIDYNGNVMPCCNARSDIEAHQPLILGNINEELITDIAIGEKREQILAAISSADTLPEPCRKCNATSQGGW